MKKIYNKNTSIRHYACVKTLLEWLKIFTFIKRLEINTKLYIVICNIVFTCFDTVQSIPVDLLAIFWRACS